MLLNRKLIIAVLTIGLMLSFSSAAIGYDDTKMKPHEPLTLSSNPAINAPALESYRNVSGITKPTQDNNIPYQVVPPPVERECQFYDYLEGGITSYYGMPNIYGNIEFGNMYQVPAACTLNTFGLGVYGSAMLGIPDVEVTLWAGNGSGYPTTAIGTWTFLQAELTGGVQYLVVDLTAEAGYPGDYMFAEGDQFFITGATVVNSVDDYVGYLAGSIVDPPHDATIDVGRTTYDETTWYTMGDDYWGGWPGRAFMQFADICYEENDLSGDCAWNVYYCDAAWFWRIGPTATNAEEAMGVRFTPAGPETLLFVDVVLYDAQDDVGDGSGTFPNAIVGVYPEAGVGGPDMGSPILEKSVPYSEYDWPYEIDVLAEFGPIVVDEPYFVAVSVDAPVGNQQVWIISDDADCGSVGRSGMMIGGDWYPSAAYGDDFNWHMDTYTCLDVYSTCGWDGNYLSYSWAWSLPNYMDAGETMWRRAFGSKFQPALAGCDLGDIDYWFYDGAFAEDAEVAIYDATGVDGLPGNRLHYIPITGGSWPSGYFKLSGSLFFDTPIWIVLESFATNPADVVIVTGDDDEGPAGTTAIYWTDEAALPDPETQWTYMADLYGYYDNPVVDIFRCCYPFVVRTCAPDGDWPTFGKDFVNTQSTLNEVGDIQCNLTKSWTYVNSNGQGCTFAQPIVANGYLFAYMFNCLVCVDINTGLEVWRRDINYAEIGGSCRATPTYHNGFLYCGGGDNGYFAKFNATTGATVWLFAMNAHAQYAPHVIMDIDGTECVVVGDGLGNIYALKTADGDNYYYPGLTTAAFTTSGQIHRAMTTDGTYLYTGCDEYLTTPNVYRLIVDASGITEDWNLVDDGPGFQLPNVSAPWAYPELAQEGCYSAILYSDEGADGQWIYFHTSYSPQGFSPHNGGIIYKVSADGTTLGWASETNGSAFGSPSAIVNDKAQVIFGGYSGWVGGAGDYNGPMAFAKSTGLPQWGPNDAEPRWSIQANPSLPDAYADVVMPGVLTCESIADPSANDWFIYGEENGWWNFVDATVGEIVWHRRSARFNAYVTGPIVDEAGHILFGEGWNIHSMANATPRQRLHIANLAPELPVPFGLPSYHEIVFEDVLANSGCAPLEIFHVELLDVDNGTFPGMLNQPNQNIDENVSTLTKESSGIKETIESALDSRAAAEGFQKTPKTTAAYALPDYILSLEEPIDGTIIPAGGSVDIRIAINGELVPRGASQFYAEIDSDDPDYFLDSAYMDFMGGVPGKGDYAKPTMLLTVIGGCLYENTTLFFGEEGTTNWLSVWNSTLIMVPGGGGDDGLNIDDDNSYLYGCDGLFYSDSMDRIVMHAYDGGGNPIWESILPDPLPTCDFAEANDVVLAQMSNDGSAYSNVLGTMLNYAYVDSVEDHRVYTIDDEVDPPETTVTWEWDVETNTGLNKPYSEELTEGFAFKAFVTEYAVTSVTGPKYAFPDFWNFVLSRHAVYSRYGTAIPGLYVGMVADWDIDGGGQNTSGYSEEYSVSWLYNPPTAPYPEYGGGVIKIPFGPGYTPMLNTVDATTAWYGGEEPGFDSMYVWMSRPSTQFMNYQPYPIGTDRRLWSSIAELNLPAWAYTGSEDDPVPPEAFDTYGFAFFGKFTDHSAAALDNYSGMATLINKFAGFGRGDMNDDGAMNLVDIVYLNNFVHHSGNGPFPFMHLGDVNNDGNVDNLDITYMIAWYFDGGPNPVGDWALPQFVF